VSFAIASLPLAPHIAVSIRHEERNERLVFAGATRAAVTDLDRAGDGWLGPTEARHVAALKFPKRRDEYRLGRYVAKSAVAAWLGAPALSAIDIVPGAFQQPIVHAGVTEPVGVTLAHSGDLAVAIAHELGHPLGVDLELIDPARLDVVRSQVSAAELAKIDGQPLPEPARAFLLWTAKEALSKALRCGLTCPFEILAINSATVDAEGVCSGMFVNFGQYRFHAWLVGGYAFAFVGAKRAEFEPALPELRRFTLSSLLPHS
jgi:4'-phosphopantetheinyl transferase